MLALHRDFFGDSKVVVERMIPIDQIDGFCVLPHIGLDFDAVAQQAIDILVDIIEASGLIASYLLKFIQRFADQRIAISLPLEKGDQQQIPLDIAIVQAFFPVPQIPVPQFLPEELDHPILRGSFPLPDSTHEVTSSSL